MNAIKNLIYIYIYIIHIYTIFILNQTLFQTNWLQIHKIHKFSILFMQNRLICLYHWYVYVVVLYQDFPGNSDSEEPACNAGDPSLSPRLRRSPGEGRDCPLQDSWASLVAQTVTNPPAMRETVVWSLGWEYPLGEGMATHSRILAWRIPWTEEPGGLQSTGSQSRTRQSDEAQYYIYRWHTAL